MRVKSHRSFSLFYLHKTFLFYILSFLDWNRKRLRWEKETVYSVLRSMKISVGSIQSSWLGEKGGGGLRTISVRRLHWKRKETFWNSLRTVYSDVVFLYIGVSQLLLCYQQPSYWGGGGGSAHFNSRFFFCRNFRQIFFFHQWPLSLTVKDGIENIASYIGGGGGGGGCQIQQNFYQELKRRRKGY